MSLAALTPLPYPDQCWLFAVPRHSTLSTIMAEKEPENPVHVAARHVETIRKEEHCQVLHTE